MTTAHSSPDAKALAAEAEHLRAGFDALCAQITAKVRLDRELAAHLEALRRQAALVEPSAPVPGPERETPAAPSSAGRAMP